METNLDVAEVERRSDHDRSLNSVLSDPRGAVLTKALVVEADLRALLLAAGIQEFGLGSIAGMAAVAERQGLIDEATARALHGLATMRNLAAHSRELTSSQAHEFLAVADAMISSIRARTPGLSAVGIGDQRRTE